MYFNLYSCTITYKSAKFKVFLRSGATSTWPGEGPSDERFVHLGEKLSTIEKLTQYFPGFKCIDETFDKQLREAYGTRFNIPLKKWR